MGNKIGNFLQAIRKRQISDPGDRISPSEEGRRAREYSNKSENPLTRVEDDTMGRGPFATHVAQQILETDPSEGLVVGLIGPWGSGKTTLANFIVIELLKEKEFIRLDFNPWFFSSSEDLIKVFFTEVGLQIKQKSLVSLDSVSDAWAEYGYLVKVGGVIPIPGASSLTSVAAAHSERLRERRNKAFVEGIDVKRKELGDALTSSAKTLIVVIDDIDRLETREIRDIFRLVRLTGSFPYIIYIVTFDRERIEAALSEDGINGRAYVEKIIQLPVDVPIPSMEGFDAEVRQGIDDALNGIETLELDRDRFERLFSTVMRPLFRNMRDVKRYQLAIQGTVRSLGLEVNFTDLLVLESLRVFRPDIFGFISANAFVFVTRRQGFFDSESDDYINATVTDFIERDKSEMALRKNIVRLLFPVGYAHYDERAAMPDKREMVRNNRVADSLFLARYLDRTEKHGIANYRRAKLFIAAGPDGEDYGKFLATLDDDELRSLFYSVSLVDDTIPEDGFVALAIALGNVAHRVPVVTAGFVTSSADDYLAGIVLRSICEMANTQKAESVLAEILAGIWNFDSRFQLLRNCRVEAEKLDCTLSEVSWDRLKDEMRQDLYALNLDWLRELKWLASRLAILNDGQDDLTELIDRDTTGRLADRVLLTSLHASVGPTGEPLEPPLGGVVDPNEVMRIFQTNEAAIAFVERFDDTEDADLKVARDSMRSALGMFHLVQSEVDLGSN